MLAAVYRKAMADLLSRPLQTVLLFAVIAAAAATLSLALNVQSSAARPYDRLRAESNGADLWLGAVSPQTDLASLSRTPGVKGVSGPFPVSWTNYGIRSAERKQQLALVGMDAELPLIDHPVVTSGRWLAASGSREIVIDRGAAQRLDLEIGQPVELLTPNGPETFTVVGFAVPTGRAPAPIDDPAFAFVLRETLSRLEPDAVFGADGQHVLRLGVQLEDPSATLEFFRANVSPQVPINLRTWQDVRQTLRDANQFDVIFLDVFSVFALLAAGLIIANAVSGQVLSQLRDIGLLKAIGFTPRQVTLVVLSQNLVLSLAAGVVGVLAGLLIAPFFLERSAEVLGVPAAAAVNPALLGLVIAIVALLVGLFTLLPAWRAGRVGAMQALNAGPDAGSGRTSRLAALAARFGLPRVAVVGIKDTAHKPARTLLTLSALVLAVVTATFSLGIEATFNKTMSEPTVIGGQPYDLAVDRDLMPDADARRLIESQPEVESYLVTYGRGARLGRRGFDIRAVEGNLQTPRWAMREGRMPERAGEAAVSTRFAAEFGVDVGDRFTISTALPNAADVAIEVVGSYVDAEGIVMMVKNETLPAGPPPSDYLIHTRPGSDNRELANRLIDASGGNLDPEVLEETIADIRDQWRPVLIGLNGVLFTIAGLNLLSSLLVSVRERRRDFAVLKTLGFTPAQIAQSVFSGSAVVALVAVLVGLPLGLVATRVMFDVLSSAAGIGTGVGQMPGVLWLVPLVPGAIAVAALATILPARRAATLRVAEALRYE